MSGPVLSRFLSRRALLRGAVVGAATAWADAGFGQPAPGRAPGFTPLSPSTDFMVRYPGGYYHTVLVRWGDPILPGGPEFVADARDPAVQALQFGFNCDQVAFLPLPAGSSTSSTGLLVVGFKRSDPAVMFSGRDGTTDRAAREMIDTELAALGAAVIVVKRQPTGKWTALKSPSYNRRLTGESPFLLTGPGAGHALVKTSYDPAGTHARGTLGTGGGAITPWGTVLLCEEDFASYFGGNVDSLAEPIRTIHRSYGLSGGRGWERYHPRFDVTREPHEPMRFGWIIELDPYDPASVPAKRTALGRLKHDATAVVRGVTGQIVVYTGDSEVFQHVYKFVSAGRHVPERRDANRGLLDAGTLHAARFLEDGRGEWLPLLVETGPLTRANGFASQADVLLDARRAAGLLGATRMDHPEGIQVNPKTGKVYAVMNGNAGNRHGHIIEIIEDGGDHASLRFRWNVFLAGGSPEALSAPHHLTFDADGRMWVTTAGQPVTIGRRDAVYVIETEGPRRGRPLMFLTGPPGAAIAGPAFTPDHRTLFLSIQDPGKGTPLSLASSRFPRYALTEPPRPSVIAVFRPDGRTFGH